MDIEIIPFNKLSKEEIKEKIRILSTPINNDNIFEIEEELKRLNATISKLDNSFFPESLKKAVKVNNDAALEKIKDYDQYITDVHILNFFAFIDYLCSIDNDMKMIPPSKFSSGEVFDIEGEFSKELWEFCNTSHGINLVSWYDNTFSNEPSAKGLSFKDFDKDIKLVKKFFLSDWPEKDFVEELNQYIELKKRGFKNV